MRLGIAYDGTNFNGWSRQPDLRTVQGEIEKTLDTTQCDEAVGFAEAGT